MSELMWIPVPAGRVDGTPVLGVVMTPRLDQTLGAAGMADWPAAVNAHAATGIRVQTRAAGSTTPDASGPSATLRSTARSDVWQAFFGTIAVTPFSPPRGYHPPYVAKTSRDADAVRATYARAAGTIADPQVVEQELASWTGETERPEQPDRDAAVARDAVPDFHRAVTMLREHPPVLRLLGLIVDLELRGLPHADGDREISVTWDGSPVPVRPRWTRYQFDGELFLPASDGDIAGGMVDLTDHDRWRIISFDVDGGVGKLRGAARTMAGDRSRRAEGAPDVGARPTLPPLRSAGMMLTRVGREDRLAEKAAQGMAAATGGGLDKVLTAEDLVLGYRIDVRLQNRDTWYSLHRRKATYSIGDLPNIVVDDEEGHAKPHAAVLDDAGLRTDEVVVRWDGWSLSVPRPRLDGRAPANRRTASPLPYTFEVGYDAVPASLLELEFGKTYQLRARVADLAGGGLELGDPAAGLPTQLEAYARGEPVPPPRLVPPPGLVVSDAPPPGAFHLDPSVVGPGGSAERLVIRSDPVAAGFSTDAFAADPAYPDNHSRLLQPPVTTLALAEQHGFLRLADAVDAERASRAFVGIEAGEVALGAGHPTPLPDPAALGVAAAILVQPGLLSQEQSDARPWEGTWPDLIAKQIELTAGPPGSQPRVRWVTQDDQSSPDGEASPRVQVLLPPGCQVDVEASSPVLQDWIDHFALGWFLKDAAAQGSPTAAQDAMVNGRHPLLNPPLRLTLTHAVRRPLGQAHGRAVVERLRGETVARILPSSDDLLWGIHVASTGSIEVAAHWQEWGDAAEPSPASAVVAQVNLPRGTQVLPELRHDFGDTRHRRVTFSVTSLSRFRDCFVDTDPALFANPGQLDEISVLSTARPIAPVVLSVVPAFGWHEERAPGTLTRQRLGGRLRVELAHPWFTTGEGEALAVLVWPDDEDALPTPIRDQVSWSNRDPIHATSTPPALVGEGQLAGFRAAVDVTLPLDGQAVRALVYDVFFHDGHWYADVELPGVAAASYAPFVRLAVARFQSESVAVQHDDLRRSTVVTTELAPVLPDRTLVVTRGHGGLEVRLSGLARLADFQANRVFASLERFDGPSEATASSDLMSLGVGDPGFGAWMRVPGATVSGLVNQPLQSLTVPGDLGPLRLIVREVEEMRSDASTLGVDAPDEISNRTVFVDLVDLSSL